MMTLSPLHVGLALGVLAGPAASQTPLDVQEIRPKSCPAADSLVGRPVERPRGRIYGAYDRQTQTSMVVSADLWVPNAKAPLTTIWVTIPIPGNGPVAAPALGLQLRLKDSVLHTGAGALLHLQFDEAPPLRIGEMDAKPFRTSGGQVDQVLTIGLTATETLELVRATRVSGTVGRLEFVVPPTVHQGMVAAFLAAACGVNIK